MDEEFCVVLSGLKWLGFGEVVSSLGVRQIEESTVEGHVS